MLDRRLIPVLAAAAALLPAAGATAAMGPHVMARPHNTGVGMQIALKGRRFPANAEVQIAECGKTFWLSPSDPCLAENAKTVTTDMKGRFETTFDVGLCPEGEPHGKLTQRVCYVGELRFGEDTGELVGAAKLIVTYP